MQIQEFVPGNYLGGGTHRVILQNTSGQYLRLNNYLLVTRDYSVLLESNRAVAPGEQFVITKLQERRSDYVLSRAPNFLIRLYSRKVPGNYCALFNPQGRLLDAFYNSQLKNVPFLPDSGTLILRNQRRIGFKLPPESNPAWGHYPFAGDPAVGYERAEGSWRVISAQKGSAGIYPRLRVEDFTARFADGIVTLEWTTLEESNIRYLSIDRSTDQREYSSIGRIDARNRTGEPTEYTFFDTTTRQNETYYYRIRNVDLPSQRSYSRVIEVETTTQQNEFWWEVGPTTTTDAREVDIRFFSAYSQPVRIKLLTSDYHELAILFNNLVYAETQTLLKFNRSLPPGDYLLCAMTEKQRYFQPIRIR